MRAVEARVRVPHSCPRGALPISEVDKAKQDRFGSKLPDVSRPT